MKKRTYFTREALAGAAEKLLADYERVSGPLPLPVPIEPILEQHLGLSLEFADLKGTLRIPDLLGAIYMEQRRVVVDATLDPSDNSAWEGRYRFTLAHEVGHWELHRFQFLGDPRQGNLFGAPEKPSILCRAAAKPDPLEWQANQFAANLIMPEAPLRRVWQAKNGGRPTLTYKEMRASSAQFGTTEVESLALAIAQDLAAVFAVSTQAMRIRLGELGILQTRDPGGDELPM